jgi:hypothetical protein
MATYERNICITLPVAADYSASQYRFMTINASGQAARTGDGADADGVLQNDPDTAGQAGAIAIFGRIRTEAGGTVTAGGVVSSDANGRAVDSTSGDYILGRAVTGATEAGVIVEIVLSIGHSTL